MGVWRDGERGDLVRRDAGRRGPVRPRTHLDSGHRRLVDRVRSEPLPYLDEGMLRPSLPARRPAPVAEKPPVEIPEQVLRIFVGDLAPQVAGALNFVQTNELANAGAAMGTVALGALLIPTLLK